MIYEMARDLDASLRARLYPIRVSYSPERLKREDHASQVLVWRDHEATDNVRAVQGSDRNPRLGLIRDLAVRVVVFARSSKPGARVNEHHWVCEQYVDAVMTSLAMWLVEGRTGTTFPAVVTEARYLGEKERPDLEQWPGVAYQIRFRVPRGVRVVDYTGQGQPEATVAGVGNRIEIQVKGQDDPPEILEMPPPEPEEP